MLQSGFSDKDAEETLSQAGINLKSHKEKQKSNTIISAHEQHGKIRGEILSQQIPLNQQKGKHANLGFQPGDVDDKKDWTVRRRHCCQRERKIEELLDQRAHDIGPGKVMLQTISAVPDDSEEDLEIVSDMSDKIVHFMLILMMHFVC